MEVIAQSILPMLEKLTSDDIPNIRFNVAKTYAVLINVLRRLPDEGTIYSLEKAGTSSTPSPRGQELIDEHVMPSLEKLQKDDDVVVRFFATTAVTAVTAPLTAAGGLGEPMNTSP
jgi:serine/threonine-protein phosphatase 2A regulatory subunit A